MQTRQTFAIRYYCRESKKNKQGVSPIEMSIIINGERVFITLPRKMKPKEFEKDLSSRGYNETKHFLSLFETRANNSVTQLVTKNLPVTAQRVKDYMLGNVCDHYGLKKVILSHLALLSERTKREITLECYKRYETTYDTLLKYLGDKDINEITTGDMLSYRAHILNTKQTSTAHGYLTRAKSLFKHCIDNGWLQTNPMNGIKNPKGEKRKEIPTMEEYQRIVNKHFEIERLERVREMFVLAASTGLAYCDLMLLSPNDIKKDKEGNTYIEKCRKKTDVTFTSVVFPEGVAILDKYKNDITPLKKSNQRLNGYLVEVQDLCNIKCRITMHIGRHFYCSRLIQNGVSPAIVQKALGHSKVNTTLSFYTHITTESVIKNIKGVI